MTTNPDEEQSDDGERPYRQEERDPFIERPQHPMRGLRFGQTAAHRVFFQTRKTKSGAPIMAVTSPVEISCGCKAMRATMSTAVR